MEKRRLQNDKKEIPPIHPIKQHKFDTDPTNQKLSVTEENKPNDCTEKNDKSETAESCTSSAIKQSNTSDVGTDSDSLEDTDDIPKKDNNMSVVATHYNELKEAGRAERLRSRILYMRNFNNWIKSELISEYLTKLKSSQRRGDPIRVLDMCCGKGGDLLKWEKANITHLICTDIADVSVDQCKKRYEEICNRIDRMKFASKFTAEFIACDSTLVRLRERFIDKSLKLHLVSCQFAFHYSFESLSQADCMVRNAAECLQPGGYFIATIPDAYEIMRRLKASNSGRSFGNDLYNIEFVCDTNPPPLFGAKYVFFLEGVVDCPEFLVHFPTLVKLCRKHGLKLERKTTFAKYFNESLQGGRGLLQRMSGLQRVSLNHNLDNAQYAHLKSRFKSGTGVFGTLSQSEWEAASLYLVCAFKKCKNTWDPNGKPVFEFDDEK